jgi:hypothetical protein
MVAKEKNNQNSESRHSGAYRHKIIPAKFDQNQPSGSGEYTF